MGRVALSGPFFSTAVIGVQSLLIAGNETQKKELLPKISSGQIKIALAFNESTGNFDETEISNTISTENQNGWTLNGEKLFVNDAAGSDYFVVASKSEENEGISLFLVPSNSEGVEIEKMEAIGGEKLHKVKFNEIKIEKTQLLGQENEGWETISKLIAYGASGY